MGMGFLCNNKNSYCCNPKSDFITLDLNVNINLNSKNINYNSQNKDNKGENITSNNKINNNTNNINLNIDESNTKNILQEILNPSDSNKKNLPKKLNSNFSKEILEINNSSIYDNNCNNTANGTFTGNDLQKNLTKKNSFYFDKNIFINMKKRNLFDEYEIVKKLGEGAFGCVYKIFQKKTSFHRAVKVIKKPDYDKEYLMNEIVLLKNLDHPNIIKTFECYFDANYYYMIQEYCSGGDLYDYIKKQKFFTEKKAACIMYQLLSAINHLHSKKIVHRDLKPENIVFISLDSNKTNPIISSNIHSNNNKIMSTFYYNSGSETVDYRNNSSSITAPNTNNNEDINKDANQNEIFIKLIDFGTSIYINNQPLTQELGTIYYIAPEVFKNNYNEKCDLWSCGVILYTMLCGHPPFRGRKEEEIKNKILKGEGNIASLFQGNEWKKVSKQAIDFICLLLEYNIDKRLSAEKALNNKWIKNLINADDKDVQILDENIISNLIKFHSSVTLQKASLAFIAIQTGESEDVSRIKKEFDKIDINRDGVISKKELIECN